MSDRAGNSIRVLSFMPFSGIWPHALAEAQLLKLLGVREFEPFLLTCGRGLSNFCTVMESRGMSVTSSARVREGTCDRCCRDAQLIARSTKASHRDLAEFTKEEDASWIESQLAELAKISYEELEVDGLPIGRIAAYETLIKFKKTSTDLGDDEFIYYKETLGNCLAAYATGSRALKAIQPSVVIIYSPQYGVPGVIASLARANGCRVIFAEGSSNIAERYSSVRLWDWVEYGLVNPALDAWENRPGRDWSKDLDRSLNHVEELAASTSFSVYSEKARGASARSHFGIQGGVPIVLAALSSYDEAYSAVVIGGFPESKFKSHVFVDQFTWIKSLIAWAHMHPEVCLVVRLHPRDFANKREDHVAEQAERWDVVLTDLPGNVLIDHPSEAFPLHDLLGEVSVLTTGWSATAIEAMLEGIPVVTYDKYLPSYPADIHLSGESADEYFANLERALRLGRSPTHRQRALEWLTFNYVEGTVRTGGRFRDRGSRLVARALALLMPGLEWLLPGLTHRLDLAMPVDRRDRAKLRDFALGDYGSLFEVEARQASGGSRSGIGL
jgi:hypothetical protein